MSYLPRLRHQEQPSTAEYTSDAENTMMVKLRALQKIIQYKVSENFGAEIKQASMEYVVDVLYALLNLYTTPHGMPKRTYQTKLKEWHLLPFYRSQYASVINKIMAPFSFLFMRESAFVDLPTTQHLELYYAFMKYFLSVAKQNGFIVGSKTQKMDYTTFLQDQVLKESFTSAMSAITAKSGDIITFLIDSNLKTSYSETTAIQAESTARRTYYYYVFTVMLLPLSASDLDAAKYADLVAALQDVPRNLLSNGSFHRTLFEEAKRMVKDINYGTR